MAVSRPRLAVNPVVFFVSAAMIVGFVGWATAAPKAAAHVFSSLLDVIATDFGWFYVLSVAFFLACVLWLAVSPYGHIRLGDDDSRPDFSTPSWYAMLFSAGMGIGIVFFGVAEPIMHFRSPPVGEGGTPEAAKLAMNITFFHWGPHAWSIYILLALSLAYFHFRKKLPLSIRSALYPILGERIHGPIGHAVDILAVFGTVFGLATSLGFGAMQVNAGLDYLFGIEESQTTEVIIIALITAAATTSLVTGLDKGIKLLSEVNMGLAALLLAFVFLCGPTLFLLNSFADNIGHYLRSFIPRTFWTAPMAGNEWQKSWTLFYWGWWISWAPFVGMFIARISRGRTVREFVVGVLLVPTAVTFFWFTVFGDTALYLELFGGGGIGDAVSDSIATAIYALLEHLPLASVTSLLAAVVVATFFVTSSDSGSFVVDMLTSGGDPDPPVWQRIFWATTEGAVAAALLLAGGLKGLQSAAICTGLPFCLVMIAITVSLIRALRADARSPVAAAEAAAAADSTGPSS